VVSAVKSGAISLMRSDMVVSILLVKFVRSVESSVKAENPPG